MTTILLDMDGPLADFDRAVWMACEIEGLDHGLEDPTEQHHRWFTDHLNKRDANTLRAIIEQPGWFYDLPVTPFAQAGVDKMLADGIDLWVCTKPLEANPTCLNDKAAWLAEHFPALHDRLICAPDKSLIKGDLLIDDAPKKKWLARAEWEPVLFRTPWNGPDSKFVANMGRSFLYWNW